MTGHAGVVLGITGDRWVTSQVMGWVTGQVMNGMTGGEESGNEVREVGMQCVACWVWRTCGRVLSDHNSHCHCGPIPHHVV